MHPSRAPVPHTQSEHFNWCLLSFVFVVSWLGDGGLPYPLEPCSGYTMRHFPLSAPAPFLYHYKGRCISRLTRDTWHASKTPFGATGFITAQIRPSRSSSSSSSTYRQQEHSIIGVKIPGTRYDFFVTLFRFWAENKPPFLKNRHHHRNHHPFLIGELSGIDSPVRAKPKHYIIYTLPKQSRNIRHIYSRKYENTRILPRFCSGEFFTFCYYSRLLEQHSTLSDGKHNNNNTTQYF